MHFPSFFRLTLLILIVAGISSKSLAFLPPPIGTDFTWTGNNSSDWSDPANWSPSLDYPGNTSTSDTAFFDSTGLNKTIEVGLSGQLNPSLATLTFTDSYTLNIDNYINSSSLTVSGLTEIQSGNLVLGDINHQGSYLNGNIQVNSGARLSGFGAVNNLDNFGTLALGDSTTTAFFTSQGNFTAEENSVLKLKVGNSNDILAIAGNANLNGNGSIVIIPQSGFSIGSFHFIIQAFSGVNGTFHTLVQPSALNGVLDYTTFAPSYVVYILNGLTPAAVYGPKTYANQQLALARTAAWLDSQLQDRILGYASDKEGGKNTSPHDPTLWLALTDGNNKLSNAGSGFKTNSKHAALGLEKSTRDSLCGLSLTYTDINSDGFMATESNHLKGHLYQIGSYGSYDHNNWRLGAHLSLGITDNMDNQRWIALGPDHLTVTSQFQAHSFSAQAQASYLGMHQNKGPQLQPLAGLHYQWLSRNHFMEQGNTGLELDVSHAYYHSLRSQLGFAFESDMNEGLHPFALAAWEHEFANKTALITANMLNPNPNAHFGDLSGTPISREAFLGKLGVSVTTQKIWHLSAFYQGRHTSHYHENAGKLQISYNIL